jgi:hypothetical protein
MKKVIEAVRSIEPPFYNLIITAIFVLIYQIPGILQQQNFDDSEIERSIESSMFKTSIVVLIFSSLPLILDLSMDFTSYLKSGVGTYDLLGRLIFSLTTLITGIRLLTKHDHDFFSTLKIIFSFRTILYGCLMFCLCVSKPKLFTPVLTTTATTLMGFDLVLQYLAFGKYDLLFVISYALSYILLGCLLLSIYWKLKKMWRKKSFSPNNYSSIFYLSIYLMLLCASYLAGAFGIANRSFLCLSPFQLSTVTYVYALSAILLTIVPGRIARMHMEQLKVTINFSFVFDSNFYSFTFEYRIISLKPNNPMYDSYLMS